MQPATILVPLLWLLASCVLIVLSANLLVRGLTKVAQYVRLNEFVIGFLVVGFATSVPELFVGVSSALNGTPALSLGNIIGANILDMTFVVGVAAILGRGIKVESKSIRTDTVYTFIILLLPILLMADRTLSRTDGCILILVFAIYLINLLRQEHRFHEKLAQVSKAEFTRNLILCALAMILLLFSSHYVVKYGILVADEFNVPPILVGLVIISFGTSLPELTFESRSVMMKHGSMALGDLLGSVAANTTLILGIVAIIHPIQADFMLFITSASFMVVVGFIFMTFVESEKLISWQEGIALIFLYILFIIVEMNVRLIEVAPLS